MIFTIDVKFEISSSSFGGLTINFLEPMSGREIDELFCYEELLPQKWKVHVFCEVHAYFISASHQSNMSIVTTLTF